MIVHSPRMIAGLAMLSLGFFDGILGVAWLSIHDDLGVSLESLGWVLGAVGVGSAFGSAMFPTVVRSLSHLNVLALFRSPFLYFLRLLQEVHLKCLLLLHSQLGQHLKGGLPYLELQ